MYGTTGTQMNERKGLSPLVSAVLLIIIIFGIAAIVSPWMYELVTGIANQTSTDTGSELKCSNAAFDFDSGYGSSGVKWGFSEINNSLSVKIRNTGTVSLYNFSFEIIINDSIIEYFSAKAVTQRTASNPLKPGQSAFINASFTSDVNETLTDVKVLNIVCPTVYASIDL